MLEINKVILSGRLTRDPELKYTPKGQAVCKFSIAISRRYQDTNGAWQETVAFVPITSWGKQAETCGENLRKGSPVYVEGSLVTNSWQTKEGQKRSTLEVVAWIIKFLAKRESTKKADTTEEVEAGPVEEVVEEQDSSDGSQKVPF